MKTIFLLILSAIFSTPALAESPPTMQEQMKKFKTMASGAGKPSHPPLSMEQILAISSMYKCIDKKTEKNGFALLQAEGRKEESQIKELCKEKKMKEALDLQHNYASSMAESAAYKAMQGCAKEYERVMKGPLGWQFATQMKRAVPMAEDDICL